MSNPSPGTQRAPSNAQFFNIPLIPLVIWDVPRRRPWLWQVFLLGACWAIPDILVGEMYNCDFFGSNYSCGNRDFLNLFAFAYGLPVLGILALWQNRFMATIGACQFLILLGILLVSQGDAPKLFYRNMVNCTSSLTRLLPVYRPNPSRPIPRLPHRHQLLARTRRSANVRSAPTAQDPISRHTKRTGHGASCCRLEEEVCVVQYVYDCTVSIEWS